MVKKQLIIDKALELFAEQGFEATSVQQITELCGISKGAFYLSFKSKDELIIALIDYFFTQAISDIDSLVRTCKVKEKMLYEFYYHTFDSFNKHSAFAKILMKEQIQPFNEDMIKKFTDYDSRINDSILYLLDQLYEDDVHNLKYDLLICIKGFMKIHVELYLHYNFKLDIELLATSLTEKTNLLAQNPTTPFLSQETFQAINEFSHNKDNKDEIITLIEQKITELDNPIEIESLDILKQNLMSSSSSMAITKGLLENLKSNPQCKWIAYLVREHYQL